MNKLSVTIITKNEESNIERCLDSVQWADEVIVVDSGSTDCTVGLCKQKGAKIIEIEWMGFGKTKKFAVDSARNDWVLSIDADEVVSAELKNKIIAILENPIYNAYKISRRSYYLGKLIKYCGWQNDAPLRLFNKNYGNFNDRILHEYVELDSEAGLIEEPVYHYTYKTIAAHINKMNNYSGLAAMQKFDNNKKSTVFGALFKCCLQFIKMYFFQSGFLDGKRGLVLAINSSIGIYMKYIKLWEMNNIKNKSIE